MGLTKTVWMFGVVVVMLTQYNCCCSANGYCWEDERIGLLQLRHDFFNDPSSLTDWVQSSEKSTDCCQWEGVVCDNTTGRVIQLDLFFATSSDSGKGWYYLNASLFLPFHKLHSLSLVGNQIAGFVEDEGFEKLSRLNNLEYLDLRGNNFNNSILSSLSDLSSLHTLYLGDNALKGKLHVQELNNFLNLKTLILSDNKIEGFESIKGGETQLRRSNLEVLDLSSNLFDNSILSSLNGLTSLKSLYLSYNKLKGSVHIKGALLNLEELYISRNAIKELVVPGDDKSLSKLKVLFLEDTDSMDKNILLQSLDSFPSLKTLYFGGNIFNQTATTLKLHNLTNLEELFMDYSSLHISLLRSLNSLSSLKNLCLSNSELIGTLTARAEDLPNFKKLEFLDLSYTILGDSFLATVGEMSALKVLRLPNSGLNGTLSAQGLCKLRCLQVLDLSYNNLIGNLPACLANLTSLQHLDLSNNQFTGNITVSLFTSLTSIQELYLFDNHFQIPISFEPFYNNSQLKNFEGDNNLIYADSVPQSWTPKFQLNTISLSGCYGNVGAFPKFLYHQHDLRYLDLSHIHFKAEFPNWLLDNNTGLNWLLLVNNSLSSLLHLPSHPSTQLVELDISNNSLYGEIPVDFGAYLPNLRYLNMSSNRFNGSIPFSFGDMSFLFNLDLSNNQLFGKIPDSLSNSSVLSVLDIGNNNLSGWIPKWMGNISNLVEIRMPNNHFEGPIPGEFCKLDLEALDLSENNISGSIPSCFSPPRIEHVRLSKNRLEGTLKDAFYNSSSIMLLDLSYNHFTGSIPLWVHRLPHLVFLLLNNNHLEDEVSTQLCQLDQLSLIDLSNNDLFGTIPKCLSITTFDEARRLATNDSNDTIVAASPESSITKESIKFTTKKMSYSYHGRVLSYMSGIDLSCNKFFGEIPPEIGNLSHIRVLNLSHNSLSGPIPSTFANLKQIESLDLSNNSLSGKIPPELNGLYSLAVFSVANNNLSGEVPNKAQFATFEESSYEGNPLLCGELLRKSCYPIKSGSRVLVDRGQDGGFMDMETFNVSFAVTYVIVIVGLVTILLINPYWRRWWFYHIEMWMTSCYYFVVDSLPKRFVL